MKFYSQIDTLRIDYTFEEQTSLLSICIQPILSFGDIIVQKQKQYPQIKEPYKLEYGINLYFNDHLIDGTSTFSLDEYKDKESIQSEIKKPKFPLCSEDQFKIHLQLRMLIPTEKSHIYKVEIIEDKLIETTKTN
jgi:hypothetical protein